jgi:transposase
MNQTNFFIGIDISASTFISSIFQNPATKIVTSKEFSNSNDGLEDFLVFLNDFNINSLNCIICFESTGVYSEKIAYFLFAKKFKVAQEHPLKVKRAFKISSNKTDSVDSQQIAEYAFRFLDELVIWQPKEDILEKMEQILLTREFIVKQKTAFKNSLSSYKKHEIQLSSISNIHDETINYFNQKIKILESELEFIFKQNFSIAQKINHLESIPGVGKLLACTLLVVTNQFESKNHKQLSSYIGIVPFKHESGSSVFKHPKSRSYGHNLLKKLLCLSSLSMVIHNETFRAYFLRKIAQGKPKRIVLNNISNKIIKLCFTLIKNNTDYIQHYQSLNPILFQ